VINKMEAERIRQEALDAARLEAERQEAEAAAAAAAEQEQAEREAAERICGHYSIHYGLKREFRGGGTIERHEEDGVMSCNCGEGAVWSDGDTDSSPGWVYHSSAEQANMPHCACESGVWTGIDEDGNAVCKDVDWGYNSVRWCGYQDEEAGCSGMLSYGWADTCRATEGCRDSDSMGTYRACLSDLIDIDNLPYRCEKRNNEVSYNTLCWHGAILPGNIFDSCAEEILKSFAGNLKTKDEPGMTIATSSRSGCIYGYWKANSDGDWVCTEQ
jgi:hypothetical protein